MAGKEAEGTSTASHIGCELLTYADAVGLLRRFEAGGIEGEAGSWLEFCQGRGIFHFLTAEFAEAAAGLVKRVGARCCVEVAAGHGALSRALQAWGVAIKPTDPHSTTPAVEALSAGEALRKYSPDLVVACWPPIDAGVELAVMAWPSVRWLLYIGQLMNGQVGPAEMWEEPGWGYRLCEELMAYSLCRWDYISPTRGLVKHSYCWLFWRDGEDAGAD